MSKKKNSTPYIVRIPTPDTFWKRFLKQPYGYEAGIAFFSAFAGPGSALALFNREEDAAAWLILFGSGGVLLFAVAKTLMLFREQMHEESIHELEGCLETLVWTLRSTVGTDDPGLRAAVFAPAKSDGTLIQLMSYVGDGRAGRTSGRLLGVATGTIGMAFRLNKSIVGVRTSDSYEDYLSELVTFWGFTRQEATQRDPDARSWYAVPIDTLSLAELPPGRRSVKEDDIPPSGILYLDSTDPEFFDDQERTNLVEFAGVGIAKFCKDRYSFNIAHLD